MVLFLFFSSLSVLSGQHDGDASGRSKQSRSEKKSRKAMLKLGMKPIPGVSRVTVKKSKNVGAFCTDFINCGLIYVSIFNFLLV